MPMASLNAMGDSGREQQSPMASMSRGGSFLGASTILPGLLLERYPWAATAAKSRYCSALAQTRLKQLLCDWLVSPQTASLIRQIELGGSDFSDNKGSMFFAAATPSRLPSDTLDLDRRPPLEPSSETSSLPPVLTTVTAATMTTTSPPPTINHLAVESICSPLHPPKSPTRRRRRSSQSSSRSPRGVAGENLNSEKEEPSHDPLPLSLDPLIATPGGTSPAGAVITSAEPSSQLAGALVTTARQQQARRHAVQLKSSESSGMSSKQRPSGSSEQLSPSDCGRLAKANQRVSKADPVGGASGSTVISAAIEDLNSLELSAIELRVGRVAAALSEERYHPGRAQHDTVDRRKRQDGEKTSTTSKSRIRRAKREPADTTSSEPTRTTTTTTIVAPPSAPDTTESRLDVDKPKRASEQIIVSDTNVAAETKQLHKAEGVSPSSHTTESPVEKTVMSATTSVSLVPLVTGAETRTKNVVATSETPVSKTVSTPPTLSGMKVSVPLPPVIQIPRFYFPHYKPPASKIDEGTLRLIHGAFENLPEDGKMSLPEFEERIIVNMLNMSKYLSGPVFHRLDAEEKGFITEQTLLEFWEGKIILGDDTSNFFHLIRQKHNDFIWGYDFANFIQEILDRHPGMEFLRETPEFQSRYATTVIARLLYVLDIHSTGRVTLADLRREEERLRRSSPPGDDGASSSSDLPYTPRTIPDIWKMLELMPDLNSERRFFSYEHFYVIYCIFWELDSDHDYKLDKEDLLKYDQHALGSRAINRIFDVMHKDRGAGSQSPPLMSYEEFISMSCGTGYQCFFAVFLINDEDKTSDRSLEFWFDVVDLDGDGYIRYHEMMFFYTEQNQRLETLNHDAPLFTDILCQMNDCLRPETPAQFTIADMKRNRRVAGSFFDMLLSLTKFLAYEQRDPFSIKQELTDFPNSTAWDRFCRREYDRLASQDDEEGSTSQDDDWDELSFQQRRDIEEGLLGYDYARTTTVDPAAVSTTTATTPNAGTTSTPTTTEDASSGEVTTEPGVAFCKGSEEKRVLAAP